MKIKLYMLLCLGVLGMALASFINAGNEQVRHIVVFKYKSTATSEQIKEATDAFRDLKNKIPGIVSFEHGENISPEKKDLGFNHVYQITSKIQRPVTLICPIRIIIILEKSWASFLLLKMFLW